MLRTWAGEVAGHGIDAIGEVFPHAADAFHLRLAAELAFGTHLARHARHLGGKAIELIHHDVDGVLQLQDFAARVHRDLSGEVAPGHGRCDSGDVAHLVGQVARHGVHALRQIFPRAGDALHLRLAAELAVGAHLARHARDFRREGAELIHHGVDGVLQLQDFAAHRHGDLAGEVAIGHCGSDFGDVAHLAGEIARHGIHAVRQIFPGAGHAAHVRLSAQNAFGAHLARHARHFRGEGIELIHHGVDGVLEFQNFAAHIHGDFSGEVAIGHGGGHLGDISHLGRQVAGHGVDAVGQILPDAGDALHLRLSAEFTFGSHFARHARHFGGEGAKLIHHRIDGVLELENFAADVHRDFAGEVAIRHRGGHFRDVAYLRREVAGHGVDAVGEILPYAADALHHGLAAQFALGANLARDACHLGGK